MRRSRVERVLLLAVAYFAAARIALLVAIPPGYATVVWPSAGIAVAALWIWGLDAWPGAFLGSFAANAVAAWSRGATGAAPIALAAWIGVGAAVQALIAVELARRATGGREPLDEERLLFRFLLVAGPVACLAASLSGTAGLLLFKTIAWREAPYSWATWWVGDAVGVAFAAPLIMLWSGRGPSGSPRGKAAVTAVLFATAATVAAIHAYAVRSELDLVRARAERRLADVSAELRIGIAQSVEVARSTADLFASVPRVGPAEFGAFARAALARHPAALALEWRPRVADADRRAFEAAARASVAPGYALTEPDGSGGVRPRARAAEYFPILYVEPRKGNESVLGYDVTGAHPVRVALERALATGEPAASAGLKLVQETKGETSVVILVPVRAPGAKETTGFVEGVYRVGDALESLLAGAGHEVKGLRVVDATDESAPQELYAKGDFARAADAVAVGAEIAGRRWRIELAPAADFQSRARTDQSWLVLGRALVLMYLTSWVVLTLYGRAERISSLVAFKTAELREQERRLMRAQRMESVGRLAGGIAHEFNNILMASSGLAQIVQQNLGPAHPSGPDLERIIASLKRGANLVSQLLTYSRKREPHARPLDLCALIGRQAKMLEAALGRRIALELSLGAEPAWIMADAGQVEQVLLNLCFNSRDALAGKGKIRVTVRRAVLDRVLETPFVPAPAGRYVALEVADSGPGIPPEVMSRLLEPFFTTKPFGEGTGLGLSVVSGIVRQHGGGLDIGRSAQNGALVTVYWPQTEEPRRDHAPAPAGETPRGTEMLLIVDDEPLVCSTLERILGELGYSTISAGGGEEALRALSAAPDVRGVVLDLVMPGMDGLETYDRMLAARPDLKVLFLSGYAPLQSEAEMKRRGAPFLGKPADPSQLALAVRETLDAPRRA